jgi:ABC-type multidrug transport system fused ATPase/permease subunit
MLRSLLRSIQFQSGDFFATRPNADRRDRRRPSLPLKILRSASSMDSNKLASLLLNLAYTLFAVFLAIIAIEALPPRPLDPDWIVVLAANLVNTVTIPLVGLGLVHLAANFSAEPRFQLMQRRLGRLATWVTLGFFMLLPLLGLLLSFNSQKIERANAIQKVQIEQKASQIRKAVTEAQSLKELQLAMTALQGPQISSDDLNQPLPQIKTQILAVVAQAKSSFLAQQKGPYSKEYVPVLKQILRISVLSLASGFGFASLAWNPKTNKSLLTTWLEFFRSLAQNRAGVRRPWSKWLTATEKRLNAFMAKQALRHHAMKRNFAMNLQAFRQKRNLKRSHNKAARVRQSTEKKSQF